jgi:hypothetical protein
MAILKKTTVVAKPATKTKSPVAKALSKGVAESTMERKARAEEMFKAGKNKPKKLIATATLQKIMVDSKTGKKTTSAPVKLKMKDITEKEFNK